MTEENLELLRNPRDHDMQVTEIEAAVGEAKENLQKLYGINSSTILNQLQGFHCSTCVPPDIIHDFDLGILPRTLQNFSQKVIFKKISLAELNKRIRNFDYGFSETKYRPSPLKAKYLIPGNNIKQTAMQMSTLAYIIPYIVRDFIEPDCLYFYNFKNLLEIKSIVFRYSITSEMVEYLRDSIAEYLHDYASLYGDKDENAKLVPKQHFLTHYPRLITIFGPLRNYMCLRAEGKHQQSKHRVQGMRNYKNLPYTLAVRHQYWQSLQLLQPLTKNIMIGPVKIEATETLAFHNLFPDEALQCTTNWVVYNDVKYISKKCLIAIGYCNNLCLPQFAAVYKILKKNNGFVFICKKVRTQKYNSDLLSYEIQIDEEFISLNPENLKNHEVFHSHKSENKLFVTIKNCFGNLY